MAKRRPDPNQMSLDLRFEERVDAYIVARMDIQEAVEARPSQATAENEFETCIEVAAMAKQALREWGESREELVHRINLYFGRTEEGAAQDPPACRKPMSIHMLNNYLSKPTDYPMPAYLLYAIHHITGSLAPGAAIMAAAGAKVVSGPEIRQLTLGKLEENLAEMRKLKRELSR